MTRAALQKMKLASSDWFTDAEIMIEAINHKIKVGEVSTVFFANERRASFVPPSAILEFSKNLIYYRAFTISRMIVQKTTANTILKCAGNYLLLVVLSAGFFSQIFSDGDVSALVPAG